MAIVAALLAGLCAAILEMSFAIPGHPDLVAAIVIFYSTRRDATTSCVLAGLLGLIGDATSGVRLGVGALWLAIVAYAVATVCSRERTSHPLAGIATTVAASFATVTGLSMFHLASGIVDLSITELVGRCTLSAISTSGVVVMATVASWLVGEIHQHQAV